MRRKTRVFACFVLLAFAALLYGCAGFKAEDGQAAEKEESVVDDLGRTVKLRLPLRRVVVANSHNTELINSIGNAIDKVIGVDAGIYRDRAAYGNRFGEENLIGQNQRALNYERIIKLRPQALLISGNGYWQEAEKKLGDFGIQVLVFNAYYTGKFQQNCALVGKLFGEEAQAAEFAAYFQKHLDYIGKQLQGKPKKTVYVEYRSQNTTVAPGAPYDKMVQYAGAKNIFDDAKSPYIDGEAVIRRNPQYIVKISEKNARGQYTPPTAEEFQARKRRIVERPGWDGIDAVQHDRILLLSHYAFGGASELVGTMYIAKFLYPEYLPELHPEEIFKTWVTKYQRLAYLPGHTYPAMLLED